MRTSDSPNNFKRVLNHFHDCGVTNRRQFDSGHVPDISNSLDTRTRDPPAAFSHQRQDRTDLPGIRNMPLPLRLQKIVLENGGKLPPQGLSFAEAPVTESVAGSLQTDHSHDSNSGPTDESAMDISKTLKHAQPSPMIKKEHAAGSSSHILPQRWSKAEQMKPEELESQRNTNAPIEDTNAYWEPFVRTCGNCADVIDERTGRPYEQDGHVARDCSRVVWNDGYIHCCPICNVDTHVVDDCPSPKKDRNLFYMLVLKRDGKPPIFSRQPIWEIHPSKWTSTSARPQRPEFALEHRAELVDCNKTIHDTFWDADHTIEELACTLPRDWNEPQFVRARAGRAKARFERVRIADAALKSQKKKDKEKEKRKKNKRRAKDKQNRETTEPYTNIEAEPTMMSETADSGKRSHEHIDQGETFPYAAAGKKIKTEAGFASPETQQQSTTPLACSLPRTQSIYQIPDAQTEEYQDFLAWKADRQWEIILEAAQSRAADLAGQARLAQLNVDRLIIEGPPSSRRADVPQQSQGPIGRHLQQRYTPGLQQEEPQQQATNVYTDRGERGRGGTDRWERGL